MLGGIVLDKSHKKSMIVSDISDETLQIIFELKKTIKYGSITLVIQDGLVTQIETSEKIRV